MFLIGDIGLGGIILFLGTDGMLDPLFEVGLEYINKIYFNIYKYH